MGIWRFALRGRSPLWERALLFGGGIAICIPIGLGCLLLRMTICGRLNLEGQVEGLCIYLSR